MRKKSFYLGVFLLLVTVVGFWGDRLVLAQEEETDKMNKIREEVERIVAEGQALGEEQLRVKRAYCGNVTAIDTDERTVTISVNEESKQAVVDEEATIINIARREITLADLEQGSFVIAMGYINRGESDQLDIRRLVVQETPQPLERQSYFGWVEDVSQEEEVIALAVAGDEVLEIIASEADIYMSEDGEKAQVEFSDISEDQPLVLVGEKDGQAGQRLNAQLVYIMKSPTNTTPSPTPEE